MVPMQWEAHDFTHNNTQDTLLM